jgi:hypothetical protein
MYLIKQVPDDPKLLEMCFDCSNFQYQLKDAKKPVEDHIFQTIFLNKKDKETWTIDEIKEDKISGSIMNTPNPEPASNCRFLFCQSERIGGISLNTVGVSL